MATLADFLSRLFGEGRVVFQTPPELSVSAHDRAEAAEVLRVAFAEELMELAGPPLAFSEQAAMAAAEWTRMACWFLVSRREPPEVADRLLKMPPLPRTASDHLAADLTFRYLPAVQRRARAIDSEDLLARRLAEVLRAWPLSGAASDLEQGPTSPIDFDGHPGLLLRFAERLADHPRSSWTPPDGPGGDWFGMALDAIGRPRSYLI